MHFWIVFSIDVITALVVLYFFFAGLADGSVSSFNGGLWVGILAALGVILGGGYALHANGHSVLAKLLLWVLAAPALLYLLFIVMALVFKPRWN